MLAITKLTSIKNLIYRALTDSYISNDECFSQWCIKVKDPTKKEMEILPIFGHTFNKRQESITL